MAAEYAHVLIHLMQRFCNSAAAAAAGFNAFPVHTTSYGSRFFSRHCNSKPHWNWSKQLGYGDKEAKVDPTRGENRHLKTLRDKTRQKRAESVKRWSVVPGTLFFALARKKNKKKRLKVDRLFYCLILVLSGAEAETFPKLWKMGWVCLSRLL